MASELAYCEIYNPNLHGVLNSSTNRDIIYGSYLLYLEVPTEDFYNNDYIIDISEQYPRPQHPFIRNWENTIKPYSLQIVKKFEYGDYELCIIKTCWLKILQRKWKNYYNSMLAKFKNPKNLMKRQITGKWT